MLYRVLSIVVQASGQMLDARGTLPKTVQMDFSTVQKKLKMGVYGGKDGVKAFKDDLLQPLRSAFRSVAPAFLNIIRSRYLPEHPICEELQHYVVHLRVQPGFILKVRTTLQLLESACICIVYFWQVLGK